MVKSQGFIRRWNKIKHQQNHWTVLGSIVLMLFLSTSTLWAAPEGMEKQNQIDSDMAQSKEIRGKVTDSSGSPLPGVTVVVKGTIKGIITDIDGAFALTVTGENQTLIFSFVGMITQEISVDGNSDIKVVMKDETLNVGEVVIVGYGQQNKESVTAAISTVNAEELVQSPAANISNALAGRLSGLTSIQASGKPGDDAADLYVRGVGTYTGTQSPLIMVDGVARDSYNDIDPNEIESLSILKDASATAVFGVRGANGVILINTKRGSKSAPKVSFSAQTAMIQFTELPKFLGAYDWASLKNEQAFEGYWINHANDEGLTWDQFVNNREANWREEGTFVYSGEDLKYFQNANTPTLEDGSANPYYDPYFHPNTDWQSKIFKKSSKQSQYNINIDGGTDKVKYFISLGYLNQGGMFETDYMPFPDEMQYSKDRYNVRVNLDFDVTKDFRISVDLGSQFSKITGMNNDAYMYQKRIMWSNPVTTPAMVDGKFVVPFHSPNSQNNVMYEIANIDFNITNNSTLNSSIKAMHKLDFITKGLSANARIAYDSYFASRSGGGYNPQLYRMSPNPNGDKLDPVLAKMNEESSPSYWSDWYQGKWRKIYAEASLNYSRKFGAHDVIGLFLFNVEKKFDPDLEYKLPHAYLGMVGRVTYNYATKYLAELNMGYNGSENFPEGQRFGFLPAFSLGYIVTAEDFFPKNNFLSYLKIRGSIGKVGNDNIYVGDVAQRYLYLPDTWEYSGGYNFGDLNSRNWVGGANEGVIGNPNVTWETATKSNIGFEARLFGEKLSLTYDYFHELRTDILSYRGTVPAIVQATLPAYNLGEVKNWGHEVEFNWRSKVGKLNYWVKGNASTNKNVILFKDEAIVPGLEYQAETGSPIKQGLYLIADGLYNSWADLYEVDGNGNPNLASPKLAINANGENYTNTEGEPVYQKDLGYGGAPLQPGEIRLTDINEDGIIDVKDRSRTGKTEIPELSYGISMGFEYEGFDFSILFQGVEGVDRYVLDGVAQHFASNYSLQEVDMYRFTEERYAAGEQIEFPIAAFNTSASWNTYFLKDASYMRLKNLEIGYTLSDNFLKKAGFTSVRLYLNATNLLTWGANSIWGDPENLGNKGYPITRSYNIGLKFNF
jgi:TonB-linked SusC/RagA family outer membrane protein